MQNPYLEMLGIMKDVPPKQKFFHLGKVKTKLPNLVINLNNMDLGVEDFKIASSLLTLNNVDIDVTNETVTHNLKDELNVNDEVLLIEFNNTFILLSKVVSI